MKKNLEKVLDNFRKKKILVLGDVMLDKYSWGEIERVNPEQPAAPLVKIIKETYGLGGAANVANNITSLGAECYLYGIIGKDYFGKEIIQLCKEKKVDFKFFYSETPTLIKQRIMAHGQQIARADYGENNFKQINKNLQNSIIKNLEIEFKKYDFLILSDYDKQFFCEEISQQIIFLANKLGIPVLVDPKPSNINYFKNCTIISPNKKEASEIINIKYSKNSLEEMGKKLCEKINSSISIITCAEEGVFVYSKKEGFELIEAKAREVSNPTGAGDTFAATLVLSMASGGNIFESTKVANYAAGIVVEKVGTSIVTIEELFNRLNEK